MTRQVKTSTFSHAHPLKGALLMLLATLLFAVADALGKQVTTHYPFQQAVWLRCVFGMLMVGTVMLATRVSFRSHRWGWHLARSLVGIPLTMGIFTGLKYIPLAEVTAIVFASPLIVALYSSLVLKEQISRGIYLAIIAGFCGVLLVVRPTPGHFHVAHLSMLAFAGAAAFLTISARQLLKSESVLALNFYVYPVSAILTTPGAHQNWVMPTARDWLLFLLLALFATLALFCVTKAVHYTRPSRLAPIDYSRILWTVALGYLIWGEFPDAMTWIGIVVIVSCGLYIVTRPAGDDYAQGG